jgi:hypothetical protein
VRLSALICGNQETLRRSILPITEQTMEPVFLLWHLHEFPDQEDDEKLIGVYRTETDAQVAIQRVKDKPGFRDAPDAFVIDKYELKPDNWADGYVTACAEAQR